MAISMLILRLNRTDEKAFAFDGIALLLLSRMLKLLLQSAYSIDFGSHKLPTYQFLETLKKIR